MLRARKAAAHRRRRIILDDDGDLVYDEQAKRGPAEFCALRLQDCADSAVDTVAWCLTWGIAKGGPGSVRYWETQKLGTPFLPGMPDPTPVVTTFCREHDLEVFGSIRMNDCHDAFGMPFARLAYPLKVQHPEFLIGDESRRGGVGDGLEAASWSGLDYAHQEVREDRLWWIEHAAAAYDLDGVDLNFFRMPWVFKPGEEQQHAHLMTDLIRRARQRLDEVGRQRGRPVVLSLRTFDTPEICRRLGFDVETYLKEGLIDQILAGGGYAAFSTPAEEMVSLGHRYGVPVYPCINCPGTFASGEGFEALRGAAANMWWAGADGLYLWNYQYLATPRIAFGHPHPEDYRHLDDMADPQNLARLDKVFAVSRRTHEQYARATAPCPLPASLGERAGERESRIPIRIGDDVPTALRNGALRDVTLRLKLTGLVEGDLLSIRFNGADVGEAGGVDADEFEEQPLDPAVVKQGVNELALAVARRGTAAREALTLQEVSVGIRYHR